MLIGREQIEALIPHAGSMSLLDEVLEWDQASIDCLSRSHLRSDNPLLRDGRLSTVHAVEYGAQAMALHGALLAQQKGQRIGSGYLVALRDLQLEGRYLDDNDAPLLVRAEQLMQQGGHMIYQLRVTQNQQLRISVRATVAATNTAAAAERSG